VSRENVVPLRLPVRIPFRAVAAPQTVHPNRVAQTATHLLGRIQDGAECAWTRARERATPAGNQSSKSLGYGSVEIVASLSAFGAFDPKLDKHSDPTILGAAMGGEARDHFMVHETIPQPGLNRCGEMRATASNAPA
jgi:hypothetical protein